MKYLLISGRLPQMKKLKIEPNRRRIDSGPVWTSCAPFLINTRGVFVHRVRHARTVLWNGKASHHVVDYFCGNGTCGTGNLIFTDDVPEDRVLCERCEAFALAAGQPSADELAGHHVHIGRVRAFRVCCPNDNN